MRILHYSLGFPPNRTGGLTAYSLDLMNRECEFGNEVILLYPQGLKIFKGLNIKKDTKKSKNSFLAYQLINALPLPLVGGIKEPQNFLKSNDTQLISKFLDKINPDVIHIHTLMGLPKEFLETAKCKHIPIYYTSHDYFGLAATSTFYYDRYSYDKQNTTENWYKASYNGASNLKLKIFQLKHYSGIKKIVKFVNRFHHGNSEASNTPAPTNDVLDSYAFIKSYYQKMIGMIDYFHFNSSITKDVYSSYLSVKQLANSRIIGLSSSALDHPIIKKKISSVLRVGYIGPNQLYKGFDSFLKLAHFFNNNQKFEFHTYGYKPTETLENITQHGRYKPENMDDVYQNIDLLIVPSHCKETFGLVVLEALSFNTFVLVSDNVGAKDILPDTLVFDNFNSLVQKIKNYDLLKNSIQTIKLSTMEEHVKKICGYYQLSQYQA